MFSNLPEGSVKCQHLDKVGRSNHHAVLAHIQLNTDREAIAPFTIWLWEETNWPAISQAISNTDCETLLVDNVEKVNALSSKLLALQTSLPLIERFSPRPLILIGMVIAIEAKYAAWKR